MSSENVMMMVLFENVMIMVLFENVMIMVLFWECNGDGII